MGTKIQIKLKRNISFVKYTIFISMKMAIFQTQHNKTQVMQTSNEQSTQKFKEGIHFNQHAMQTQNDFSVYNYMKIWLWTHWCKLVGSKFSIKQAKCWILWTKNKTFVGFHTSVLSHINGSFKHFFQTFKNVILCISFTSKEQEKIKTKQDMQSRKTQDKQESLESLL